eukprot:5156057-Ditylum_brightwellii.AAC.1
MPCNWDTDTSPLQLIFIQVNLKAQGLEVFHAKDNLIGVTFLHWREEVKLHARLSVACKQRSLNFVYALSGPSGKV